MTNPEQLTLQQELDEINIDYACRALLGGGKGKSVMLALTESNPEYASRIMAEAKCRLGSVPGIVYCRSCGEYLGDRIDGVLYKAGQVVRTPHQCPMEPTDGDTPEL